jgi:O-antigen ligase
MAVQARPRGQSALDREPLSGAYFWLTVFFVVYCARPEDWVPGLHVIPLAKISGIFAALALLLAVGRSKRQMQQVPVEIWLTLALTVWFLASSLLSPVWRGGAFSRSMDFAKLPVVMFVGALALTSLARLRRVLWVQTASVLAVSAISLVVGHSHLRLSGVAGGIYDNPNDLAFAIALNIPLALAFFLRRRNPVPKAFWGAGALIMIATLFLTGSRGGAITLGVALLVCVWHFGVQGKRRLLLLATILAAIVLFAVEGGVITHRFSSIGSGNWTDTAYTSYRARDLLIHLALRAVMDHPLFGLGCGDFTAYSGMWHEVHMAYLQVAVEGGIPALILYLLIFWRGFTNLRRVQRTGLDSETQLLAWALHGTLVAFVVGALFSPDAYQYFAFFTVMYTGALRLTVEEQSKAEGVPAIHPGAPGGGRLRQSAKTSAMAGRWVRDA